jgi:hypothetical protein
VRFFLTTIYEFELLPEPLFRLIFLGRFRHCLNALQDSQFNFEAAKRGYNHECSHSQKLRIAEDSFRKSVHAALLGTEREWDARLKFFSEQKQDEDFAKLSRLARIVQESVHDMKVSKEEFALVCEDSSMQRIKLHFCK